LDSISRPICSQAETIPLDHAAKPTNIYPIVGTQWTKFLPTLSHKRRLTFWILFFQLNLLKVVLFVNYGRNRFKKSPPGRHHRHPVSAQPPEIPKRIFPSNIFKTKQKSKLVNFFGGSCYGRCWYILGAFGIHIYCSFGIFFPVWYDVPRKIWQTWFILDDYRPRRLLDAAFGLKYSK
jgi:hypothetical protein